MSNARRPLSRAESLPEALAEPVDSPTPPDHLADYRKSLADLASAQEKVATLRQLEVSLRADAEGIATAHEKVLSDSVSGPDDDGALEELGRLRNRAELFERKIADVATRLRDAEAELQTFCSGLTGCLSNVQRALLAWAFERARQELSNQLDGTVAPHILDLVAMRHANLVPIRALEITTSFDPGSLLEQAYRLLEAAGAADGFAVPPCSLSAPGGLAGAAPAPRKPRLIGPWLNRGLSEREINDELYRIRSEHPELDMAQAGEELQKVHPELFITEEEALAMNRPISQPSPLQIPKQQEAA